MKKKMKKSEFSSKNWQTSWEMEGWVHRRLDVGFKAQLILLGFGTSMYLQSCIVVSVPVCRSKRALSSPSTQPT